MTVGLFQTFRIYFKVKIKNFYINDFQKVALSYTLYYKNHEAQILKI